jgi:hypothetical protein
MGVGEGCAGSGVEVAISVGEGCDSTGVESEADGSRGGETGVGVERSGVVGVDVGVERSRAVGVGVGVGCGVATIVGVDGGIATFVGAGTFAWSPIMGSMVK